RHQLSLRGALARRRNLVAQCASGPRWLRCARNDSPWRAFCPLTAAYRTRQRKETAGCRCCRLFVLVQAQARGWPIHRDEPPGPGQGDVGGLEVGAAETDVGGHWIGERVVLDMA